MQLFSSDAIEIILFRLSGGAFGRFHAFLSIQDFLHFGIDGRSCLQRE